MPTDSPPPKREVTATLGQLVDGRYKITAFIGDGGMGSVYRAEHVTIRKPVAIKLLHRQYANESGFADRFEREALAAGRIQHPNCVEVSDFGKLENGTLYLVMELVEGTTLGELLDRHGRLPVPRAVHIARHVLRGLGHAHDVGIIHRDVKPDNIILVDHDGDRDFAKLLDFGIAKLIGEAANEVEADLTQVGTTMGTPKYMPPEQAFGKPVDGRADLYSLSVVLYLMLTGRPPFEAPEVIDLLMMHASRQPPPFKDKAPGHFIAPELEEVVIKGLSKKRENRFASAEEYLEALEDALDAHHAYRRGDRPMPEDEDDPESAARALLAAAGQHRPSKTPHPSMSLMSIQAPPWLHRLQHIPAKHWALGIGGLLLLIVIIATAAGAEDSAPTPDDNSPGIDIIQKGAKALTGGPSELAEEARKLNREGRYQQVLDRTADRELDGFAHVERGHALAGLGRLEEAMTEYRRGLAKETSLQDEQVIFERARAVLGSPELVADLAAIELLVRYRRDPKARSRLLKIAGESKKLENRHAARKLSEKLGLIGDVNLVRSYALDLVQERKCEDRRKALLKLEELDDPRALPVVQKARYRGRGGVLGIGEKNANRCLKDDADRIADKLEAREELIEIE
jgi:serine/threonine protein kinase